MPTLTSALPYVSALATRAVEVVVPRHAHALGKGQTHASRIQKGLAVLLADAPHFATRDVWVHLRVRARVDPLLRQRLVEASV